MFVGGTCFIINTAILSYYYSWPLGLAQGYWLLAPAVNSRRRCTTRRASSRLAFSVSIFGDVRTARLLIARSRWPTRCAAHIIRQQQHYVSNYEFRLKTYVGEKNVRPMHLVHHNPLHQKLPPRHNNDSVRENGIISQHDKNLATWYCQASYCAVRSKILVPDPLLTQRRVSGCLSYRQSDRVCLWFLHSFWGRSMRGLETASSPFRGF